MRELPASLLYYVHDPMCSWCWGFDPVLRELLCGLPESVNVKRLLGGLAQDTNEPMPYAMREYIHATWKKIERRIPGTRFNFDFWERCEPRRSTYPACRAVIAARMQGHAFDRRMTSAIQRAYYTEARNPSDDNTLIELAGELGLDTAGFAEALTADATRRQLAAEIALARRLQADSFPCLVLVVGDAGQHVTVDYNDSGPMLATIQRLVAAG